MHDTNGPYGRRLTGFLVKNYPELAVHPRNSLFSSMYPCR